MGTERRNDPTIEAIRLNWPIILVAAGGLLAWANQANNMTDLQSRTAALEEQLSVQAISGFVEWKTNVVRDLKELRAQCHR